MYLKNFNIKINTLFIGLRLFNRAERVTAEVVEKINNDTYIAYDITKKAYCITARKAHLWRYLKIYTKNCLENCWFTKFVDETDHKKAQLKLNTPINAFDRICIIYSLETTLLKK